MIVWVQQINFNYELLYSICVASFVIHANNLSHKIERLNHYYPLHYASDIQELMNYWTKHKIPQICHLLLKYVNLNSKMCLNDRITTSKPCTYRCGKDDH